MTATTAGFTVTVRGRRVYLVDAEPARDPGMSHHEARELAQRLLCAGPRRRACSSTQPRPETGRPRPRTVAPLTDHGPQLTRGDDHDGQQPSERFAVGFAPRPRA
jgi:hypothetical protein